MKRSHVVSAVALAVAASGVGSVGSVEAAEPANRSCLGTSFSALATDQAPGVFGGRVVDFAQDPGSRPGLGDGIQVLQTGAVPDEIVPNTCNDAP